jgi:hypothetical protein
MTSVGEGAPLESGGTRLGANLWQRGVGRILRRHPALLLPAAFCCHCSAEHPVGCLGAARRRRGPRPPFPCRGGGVPGRLSWYGDGDEWTHQHIINCDEGGGRWNNTEISGRCETENHTHNVTTALVAQLHTCTVYNFAIKTEP